MLLLENLLMPKANSLKELTDSIKLLLPSVTGPRKTIWEETQTYLANLGQHRSSNLKRYTSTFNNGNQ